VVKPRRAKAGETKAVEAQEIEPAAPNAPPPATPALPPAAAKAPAVVAAPPPAPATSEPRRPPDPSARYVEIGSATGTVGTTTASVNKALAPLGTKLSACYRSASSPTASAGATLHVETNEDGVITDARVDPGLEPALRSCIVTAVRGRKISNVDTGSASADVPLWFKSR